MELDGAVLGPTELPTTTVGEQLSAVEWNLTSYY